MQSWKANINKIISNETNNIDVMVEYGIYSDSIQQTQQFTSFIAIDEGDKRLIVIPNNGYDNFEGESLQVDGVLVKICPLNIANSKIVREIFPFTNPTSVGSRKTSLGLGDRLGLASPGQIRLVKGKDIFPIIAQQSIRELNLTNRTYEDVLASAVWAVLQEGYTDGYGADGDHLKTQEEVLMALDCGYTMITLDCSARIKT